MPITDAPAAQDVAPKKSDAVGQPLHISEHAQLRICQRLKIKRRAIPREVERARTKGIPREHTTGQLRRLLDMKVLLHGPGDYRVHRGFVFVFKANTLVTVVPLHEMFALVGQED